MATRTNFDDQVKALLKFCPICGAPFSSRPVHDILICGMACTDDHKFYVPIETVPTEAYKGKFLTLQSSLTDRDAIANEWLTNPDLRTHLNDYVAKTLRIFLELKEKKFNIDKQNEASKLGIDHFCSLCGAIAKMYEKPDNSYLHEVSCVNGHRAHERGFELTYFNEREAGRLRLCLDFDYTNLFGFTHSFISNSEWKQKIPLQVRVVLTQYADEFLKDERPSL